MQPPVHIESTLNKTAKEIFPIICFKYWTEIEHVGSIVSYDPTAQITILQRTIYLNVKPFANTRAQLSK